jgi:hypothetical protein
MKKKSLLLTAVTTLGLTAATMAQNVPNYVPNNGLVGWWPFNGNANDESGNGNNGAVNGSTTTADRFGNNTSAYYFNGNNSRIEVSASNSLDIQNGQSLSISTWIKHDLTSTNIDKYIISKYSGSLNTGPQYAIATGITGQAYSTTQTASGTQNWVELRGDITINDGNWHHFVYVWRNGSDASIYVDNVLDTTRSHSLSGSIINALNLQFGCGANLSQYYKGSIDDIGIWNRALTSQEISDLYNGNICYQTITVTDTLLINMGITGFNPVTYNNTIKIFPNPTNDHITIDYGNFASLNGYQLKIENSLGQQVFQTNINQQSDYLNLTNWGGNGLYFVRIIDNQGNTIDIRKIVLQ